MMKDCRFCKTSLDTVFVDLGMSPLANSYLKPDQLKRKEPFYPLCVYVCRECLLVQLPEFETPDAIFSDYAYFSSFSDEWLRHAKTYTEQMVKRFGFNKDQRVIEIASNDGYLLQYFKEKGIPVLGIEPAANVAKEAEKKSIPTLVKFFGVKTAAEQKAKGVQADLLIGNNVLAHVPDINDFVAGLKIALKPSGVITMEFPHLLNLMDKNQFDTIYHEHFSYLSFFVVDKIFKKHGLVVFDVEEIPTHGGSLRIFARHAENNLLAVTPQVAALHEKEKKAGLHDLAAYRNYQQRALDVKKKLLEFLNKARREGKKVAGYGAPAKGNTLLNFCGVGPDLVEYTVDRSPHKQKHLLPGVHIPIHAPEKIDQTKPDYLLILPWNLRGEIQKQMAHISKWGGRFVVAVPTVEVF